MTEREFRDALAEAVKAGRELVIPAGTTVSLRGSVYVPKGTVIRREGEGS